MKQYILPLVLSSLLLSACGPATNSTSSPSQPESSENSPAPMVKQSLKDILGLNVTQKCSYTTSDENAQTTGTIYIKGNKFRQETQLQTPEGTSTVNAISDGEYLYTWGGQMANGLKMKLSAPDNSDTTPGQSNPVDMDKQMDLNCQAATLTDADMNPPADVQFMDLSDEGTPNFQDLMKNFAPDDQ